LLRPFLKYCSVFEDMCDRLSQARNLYFRVAEKAMGHPRIREYEAAQYASRTVSEERFCESIGVLREDLLSSENACVLGPLFDPWSTAFPGRCDLIVVLDSAAHLVPPRRFRGIRARVYLLGDGDFDPARYRPCSSGLPLGAYLLHYHGDNYIRVSMLKRAMSIPVVPTSQAVCWWNVLGLGGYTDGDRAAMLLMSHGVPRVVLEGYNFERISCSHKRTLSCGLKHRKLMVARRILSEGASAYGYVMDVLENKVLLYRV